MHLNFRRLAMDGWRSRKEAASIYEAEQRWANLKRENNLKMYKAIVIRIDEDKVFSSEQNFQNICKILDNVENDMLYADRKTLKELGLSFDNTDNGNPNFFNFYYNEESETDISVVKAKYFLLDNIMEKFRDNPDELQRKLLIALNYMPEQTLNFLGQKFNDGQLNDELQQITVKAMHGERFYDHIWRKTTKIFNPYTRHFCHSEHYFPLFMNLLEKNMLNESQIHVFRRLCHAAAKPDSDICRAAHHLLDKKATTYYLPHQLWWCEDLNSKQAAIKYWQQKNWLFDNENNKIENIIQLSKAIYYNQCIITNSEKNQQITAITKDIFSRLDDKNPKDILAWMNILNSLKENNFHNSNLPFKDSNKGKIATWLHDCLPENQSNVFSQTLELMTKRMEKDLANKIRCQEITRQLKATKNINQVFVENTLTPNDSYCFVRTGDYVITGLSSFDNYSYENNYTTITSQNKNYDAIQLGRSGYTLLIDTDKIKTTQNGITLISPKESIGFVIGKGGKNIKNLSERYHKHFSVKEMAADNVTKKQNYQFEQYNEIEKKQLHKEKERLLEEMSKHEIAKIDDFTPAPEAKNKEELFAQHVVSQIYDDNGKVIHIFENANDILNEIINNTVAKKVQKEQRIALSQQLQQIDEANERRIKEEKEAQKRIREKEEIQKRKEEHRQHLAQIAQNIQKEWGDSLTNMKDNEININIYKYITIHKEDLPTTIEAADFASLSHTMIEKRDLREEEVAREEEKRTMETQEKINILKKELIAKNTPVDQEEIVEEPMESIEITPEEKKKQKAALKEAKKSSSKAKGIKITGGLAGLSALLDGNNRK